MRTGLPESHGLSDDIVNSNLIHRNGNGEIELTDIQYKTLEEGISQEKTF